MYIHWGIRYDDEASALETLYIIIFKSDIKTGKSRCALYTHITDNKDHKIDWEKKVILDKEIHFEKRKIKEAIYINAFDDGTLMNPDKGIPVNQCWREFFPFVTEVKGY